VSRAARLLGMSRRTLQYRLRKFGVTAGRDDAAGGGNDATTRRTIESIGTGPRS
jgi:hypothetical protein